MPLEINCNPLKEGILQPTIAESDMCVNKSILT